MEIVNNLEKLKYILTYTGYYIDQLIDNVMNDSEEDPEYSAVTLNNLIICFIYCQKKLDPAFPICTVRDYFLSTAFYAETDYMSFEEKRKKESAYYIGEQFKESCDE